MHAVHIELQASCEGSLFVLQKLLLETTLTVRDQQLVLAPTLGLDRTQAKRELSPEIASSLMTVTARHRDDGCRHCCHESSIK